VNRTHRAGSARRFDTDAVVRSGAVPDPLGVIVMNPVYVAIAVTAALNLAMFYSFWNATR
jgi:hypothetical protein